MRALEDATTSREDAYRMDTLAPNIPAAKPIWAKEAFVVELFIESSFFTLIFILQFKRVNFVAYILAFLQFIFVYTSPGTYNSLFLNLKYCVVAKQDYDILAHHDLLTYKEFFSQSLFDDIKKDLQYNREGVAALGYHPSVLMYNDFSAIDGFHNSYPLKRNLAFREVIAPQLELNAAHKNNYDYRGVQMYLFNTDVHYGPTRSRANTSAELHINTEAFRKLGGVYILSRAEISNAGESGLEFIRQYAKDDSIYEIYVYKAHE
jgi:hypothetical protein